MAVARAEFPAMEKADIICRSTSPCASPLHMVKKKEGGWRPCGYYQWLNTVTVPDVYPLPNLLDFTSRINGSTVFSKLDLQKGYYQVPVSPEDVRRPLSSTPLWCSNSCACPLALGTPKTCSNALLIKFWVSFVLFCLCG